MEKKTISISTKVVKGKLREILVEQFWGFSSWIKLDEICAFSWRRWKFVTKEDVATYAKKHGW